MKARGVVDPADVAYDRNARMRRQMLNHRVGDFTADVVEIRIDAIGAGRLQRG